METFTLFLQVSLPGIPLVVGLIVAAIQNGKEIDKLIEGEE